MKPPISNEVKAALFAAQWAREMGLPHGNLWEPTIARHLLAEREDCGLSWPTIEVKWRFALGLTSEADAS